MNCGARHLVRRTPADSDGPRLAEEQLSLAKKAAHNADAPEVLSELFLFHSQRLSFNTRAHDLARFL